MNAFHSRRLVFALAAYLRTRLNVEHAYSRKHLLRATDAMQMRSEKGCSGVKGIRGRWTCRCQASAEPTELSHLLPMTGISGWCAFCLGCISMGTSSSSRKVEACLCQKPGSSTVHMLVSYCLCRVVLGSPIAWQVNKVPAVVDQKVGDALRFTCKQQHRLMFSAFERA